MTKTERDLTDGRRHQEAGEFVKAESIYNRVLRRDPRNLHARFFLGALKVQTRHNAEAVQLLTSVVEDRPDWEEAHNNLAVALQNLGRLAEALTHFEKAVEINPEFADGHNNATYLLYMLKRNEEALVSVERALATQPDRIDILLNHVEILTALGRREEALPSLIKASEHLPHDRDTRCKIAQQLSAYGDFERAAAIFEAVVADFPDFAPGYNSLLAVLERTITQFNRRDIYLRMLELADKAVELDPEYLDAVINRATVLIRLRRHKEAREIYDTMIEKIEDRFDVLNNYAAIMQSTGDYDGAIENLKRAIAITDTRPEPFYNWGACLYQKGDHDAALEKYELALQRDPNHVDTHCALGLVYLNRGDFERGWKEYEWRKQTDQFSGRLLEGFELDPNHMAGKRVFIHAEQGQGDMFQFVRYAHAIKALGGKPFVECHDGLRELIKTCPWVDVVRERADPEDIVFDQQSNLLSLPLHFSKDVESIPSQVPYLSAPEEFRPKWAARIAEITPPGTRLKVGIAWAGNPDHHNDIQRSTTLEKFGALARVPGVTFFSIQKGGKPEEQLDNPPAGMTIVPLGKEIGSFSDTAAILENLDLLIAVDTGPVHLAGAMGVPVWTLLPVNNDFRWMSNRSDSPWYPTMRLFRQSKLWDYDPLFEQVAGELERYADDPVRWQIEEATRKFESGDRNRAKVQLLALTKRYVTDTRLINAIGEFFWHDGDVRDALEMFLAALKLNQSDRKSVANCAQVLDAFGHKDEARGLYISYVDAHPEDGEFAKDLGELFEPRLLAAA